KLYAYSHFVVSSDIGRSRVHVRCGSVGPRWGPGKSYGISPGFAARHPPAILLDPPWVEEERRGNADGLLSRSWPSAGSWSKSGRLARLFIGQNETLERRTYEIADNCCYGCVNIGGGRGAGGGTPGLGRCGSCFQSAQGTGRRMGEQR